jgi:hypothetical protein
MKRPDIRRRIAELFKTCAILVKCLFMQRLACIEQPWHPGPLIRVARCRTS